MARRLRDTKLDTRSARTRLKPQKEPYWRDLGRGLALGYYCGKSDIAGTWIIRRRVNGAYVKERVGLADDYEDADGKRVLTYDEAQKFALKENIASTPGSSTYTVEKCIAGYVEHLSLHNSERSAYDTKCRLNKRVSDQIKKTPVAKLTTAQLTEWQNGLVKTDGEPEVIRKSKDTANRTLSSLKAALNLAWKAGLVPDDSAWRRVTGFKKVTKARMLFLTEKQTSQLVKKAPADLSPIVRAGILTGARFGELADATVGDFDPAEGTLFIRYGKTGPRTAYLSDTTIAFFEEQAKDKSAEDRLFSRDDGKPWNADDLQRPFKEARSAAKLPPETTFYSLRHYHISKALLAGVQPQVVAENCGTSLRMIEKHYGKFLKTDRRAMFNEVAL